MYDLVKHDDAFNAKENPFNSHKECKEQIVCGASIEVPHKLAGQGDSP